MKGIITMPFFISVPFMCKLFNKYNSMIIIIKHPKKYFAVIHLLSSCYRN